MPSSAQQTDSASVFQPIADGFQRLGDRITEAIPHYDVRVNMGPVLGEHQINSPPQGSVCGPVSHTGPLDFRRCHVHPVASPVEPAHASDSYHVPSENVTPAWQPENPALWADIATRCPNASDAQRHTI
ncbi:MAG TPA: hypothetical protein PLR25_21255 [Planctomycetaceae bacterium]|nr:hypothetical protein [Planctomycetaceae bacterium]